MLNAIPTLGVHRRKPILLTLQICPDECQSYLWNICLAISLNFIIQNPKGSARVIRDLR